MTTPITVELTEQELRAVLDVLGRAAKFNTALLAYKPFADAETKLDLALLAHEENEGAKERGR